MGLRAEKAPGLLLIGLTHNRPMLPEDNKPNRNGEATAPPPPDLIVQGTSELNNLLQIMSGTSSLIEQACQGNQASEKYVSMLRSSIQRAEKVTADLVRHVGGPQEKVLLNTSSQLVPKKNNGPAEPRKRSILLVDDEQMTLTLVGRILTEAGFQVTTAQSGFECLDNFRRRPFEFELVLLDLTMPFMDGEETFNRLRELRPDVAVVLCTGFIQQDRLQRLMQAGLAGFLRKPLSPQEIVGNVRKLLANARYSRDQVDPSSVPAIV